SVRGVRQTLHPGPSARRADGVERRRLCRVLEIWAFPESASERCEPVRRAKRMTFSLRCPTPQLDAERIQLAHGEGARLSRRLIRQELLAAFANPFLAPLADAAILPEIGGRLIMTTDSSVVSP